MSKDISINNSNSSFAATEAYRSLRTNLQFCGKDKKKIIITSTFPGEGKSHIALHLCEALAKNDEKVILVDADLRKSVLSNTVRINTRKKGLSHFLSQQAEKKEVICSTDVENFDVVLPGSFPPNPSELLDSKRMSDFLDELAEVYDHVIIDTPPVGSVIDPVVVAKYADGAMLVIEANKTSRRMIRNVQEQLEKSGCPFLGYVLNKVNMKKSSYYSKYYGKYGYGE